MWKEEKSGKTKDEMAERNTKHFWLCELLSKSRKQKWLKNQGWHSFNIGKKMADNDEEYIDNKT